MACELEIFQVYSQLIVTLGVTYQLSGEETVSSYSSGNSAVAEVGELAQPACILTLGESYVFLLKLE